MKLFISTILFFVALSTNVFAATEAQSFVGRWEVSAKEFGQSAPNNQLNEGRLIIELQNGQYQGRFNRLTFTGKLQAEGLHLVCSDQSGSCGELVLTIANGMIAGKGVQITVDVIENKSIGTPMIEDKDSIMIMGIGPSLDAAFKFATTGLADWLAENYKLNSAETAAVLGTSMQFDIAEVVDPEFNVVAKIRKDALGMIPKS